MDNQEIISLFRPNSVDTNPVVISKNPITCCLLSKSSNAMALPNAPIAPLTSIRTQNIQNFFGKIISFDCYK